MKTQDHALVVSILFAGGLLCNTTSAFGESMLFMVDPSQSSLSLEVNFVGVTMEPQGQDSLTTVYGGTVRAEVTPTTIQFPGGSSIVASNSGSWQPASGGNPGFAPANYGGQGGDFFASGIAALREVQFDVESDVVTTVTGSFPAQSLVFGFSTNANSVMDYTFSVFGTPAGNGSVDLAGYATNNVAAAGNLVFSNDEWVLSIPVDYTGFATVSSANDVSYTLTGQLVARAPAAVPPLSIGSFNVLPGQIVFIINTEVGKHYTILGRTSLTDPPTTIDEFTAVFNPTTRMVGLTLLPQQFFQVRED